MLPDPVWHFGSMRTISKEEGYAVLHTINADQFWLNAWRCWKHYAEVIPLTTPIGSTGQGTTKNAANIASLKTLVCQWWWMPGLVRPGEAAQAMELGANRCWLIPRSLRLRHPAAMARAMSLATVAGRLATNRTHSVKAYASVVLKWHYRTGQRGKLLRSQLWFKCWILELRKLLFKLKLKTQPVSRRSSSCCVEQAQNYSLWPLFPGYALLFGNRLCKRFDKDRKWIY